MSMVLFPRRVAMPPCLNYPKTTTQARPLPWIWNHQMARQPKNSIAIIGATGVVGRTVAEILQTRLTSPYALHLLASSRSAGSPLLIGDQQYTVDSLEDASLENHDIIFSCAGNSIARQIAPGAVQHGAWFIDSSSAFRMDPSVPLVIPEVNLQLLKKLQRPQIIASPNCSTTLALVAVNPIREAVGIERMVISTYQAASGGGRALMEELENQIHDHATGQPYRLAALDRPYLLNVFSHETPIGDDGYNGEERKVIDETRKIWEEPEACVTATCVRVPVLRSHCESITLTLRAPLTVEDARVLIDQAPGLALCDDPKNGRFPEPINASGQDDILVGRIRMDQSQPEGIGLQLFLSGDQLRKGAALNACQIAETLIANDPSLHT